MRTRRVIAYLLFTMAVVFGSFVMADAFHFGDIKSLGAAVTGASFLLMSGWIIGDF